MTRKDFELIAALIKDLPEATTRIDVAVRFARGLQDNNPLFNPVRFINATRGK